MMCNTDLLWCALYEIVHACESFSLSVCRGDQGVLLREVCSDAAAPGDPAKGSGEAGLGFIWAERPGKLLQPPQL